MIRLIRHWGYQSGSERVSPLHLSRRDVLPVRAQYQRRNFRTSVQPRRKGYLPKASSRVGAQTSLDVSTSTLVLPTARLGSDSSDAHIKPVGPGADSPTCLPGPVHSAWTAKPLTVRRQRRRTVSACSQSLTCAITLKARSGLKDTLLKAAALVLPCVFAGSGVSATPQRLWPAAPGTANCTGTCRKDVQPGQRGAHQRSARHGHLPRSPEGPGAPENFS